jgi:hypothetical protein
MSTEPLRSALAGRCGAGGADNARTEAGEALARGSRRPPSLFPSGPGPGPGPSPGEGGPGPSPGEGGPDLLEKLPVVRVTAAGAAGANATNADP